MLLPLFARLTEVVIVFLEGSDEERQFVTTEELIEERPKEAEPRPLKFDAATVEEERENEGVSSDVGGHVGSDHDIIKSVSQ
jgi:hypothetical protein